MISEINNKKRQTQNGTDYIIAESNNITHCVADKSYTWIYFTNREPVKFSRRLKILYKLLDNTFIVRCHKSYLVNLSYIKEFYSSGENIIILQNGVTVKVARRKLNEFMSQIKMNFQTVVSVNRSKPTVREKE